MKQHRHEVVAEWLISKQEVSSVEAFKGGTAKISQYLSGINFPCSKQDLINHARRSNAPEDVLQALQRIPDRTYNSMADVLSGVGRVE